MRQRVRRFRRITEPAPPSIAHPGRDRAALFALLFGNFVIGSGVLAPAGLVNELSAAFRVDVPTVGTLMGYGAVVLCIAAPLFALFTNRIDRRALLSASLAAYAVGHFASSYATDFHSLLVIRLVMIVSAAIFTPQAASAVSRFVAPERRSSAVAFIFMGWSFAAAFGVPVANLLGASYGWHSAYLALGAAAMLGTLAVWFTLPHGLHVPPLSARDWRDTVTNPRIVFILLVTTVMIAGQLTVYPFVAAELKRRFDAGPGLISLLLAIYGCAGVLGAMVSSAVINRLHAPRTVTVCLSLVIGGLLLWYAAEQSILLTGLGLFMWGLGFGPSVSAQQARLIGAKPLLASASVALNTSFLYFGQGIGAALGGSLLRFGHARELGLTGAALAASALGLSLWIARRLQT